MGKRIPVIIAIVLITALLAGWYFFTRESKYLNTSAFKAVPFESPVIVRIHNFSSFANKAAGDSVLNNFSGLPGFSALLKQIKLADLVLRSTPKAQSILDDKDMTIAAGGGVDNSSILYLLEMSSLTEKNKSSRLISDFFSQKNASSVKQKSGKASYTLYYWSEGPSTTTFAVSFYKGICIAGTDTAMISKAIRQLELPSLEEDPEFQKAYKTASPNALMNIYLNHKTFPGYISPLFSESFIKSSKKTHTSETWTEIDLISGKDEITLNGFTFSKDSLNSFSDILLHQQPGKFNLAKYLPEETSFFLSLNITDPSLYLNDYEQFLKNKGSLNNYRKKLRNADSTFSINLKGLVADHLDGECGIAYTHHDQNAPMENRFFLMKVKSSSRIEEAMQNIVKPLPKPKKGKPKDPALLYKLDEQTAQKIYPSLVEDFGETIFGKIFAGVPTNFFTVYDNCLIMGASYETLCDFLRAEILEETLQNNKNFGDFVSGLSQRSNLFLWTKPGRSLPFFQSVLNPGIYKELERNAENLRKIESAGFQEGVENGLIYNTIKIKYNPASPDEPFGLVIQNKPKAIWRSHLDDQVRLKPQLMINPDGRDAREIVVQDKMDNLCLINREGRIIWKRKLSGPILSEVFQINYFKNTKLQYLFNTKDAIYIIDHEGNDIENYPVKLRANATNGISVFDYENNFDYRIFVACSDHKVYAYDKKGKIVTGWAPSKTEYEVTNPARHFRVQGKDYIVFFDKEKTYILDRQGKTRVKPKEEFTHSRNSFTLQPATGKNISRIVTTSNNGTVYYIGFEGSVKKFSPGKFSDKHYFLYNDLNKDNLPDLIYLDGDSLSVFDADGKQLLSKQFKAPAESAPLIYSLPGNHKKIGIVIREENRIYLFNSDGSLYEGSPFEGNSPFSVGALNNDSKSLNLITGTADGFLNNYLLK